MRSPWEHVGDCKIQGCADTADRGNIGIMSVSILTEEKGKLAPTLSCDLTWKLRP